MHPSFGLYRRRTLVALAITTGLATALPVSAQVGIGLSPMRLELRLAAGAQHSGPLAVSNESSARLRVRAELLDFFIDSTGTPQFSRAHPQESEFTCRQWLSLNPMELELDPGTQVLVRYTMRVPPGVSQRSYHCAAGFTALPTAPQVKGIGLTMAVRAVAAFYAVVGNPRIEGGLKEIKLEPLPDAKQPGWQAVVFLENLGLMVFRPSGELVVLDAGGKVVESYSFSSIPVLPKREQRFLFPLKTLVSQGRYSLRARVDIGTGEIQEGTAVVMAQPRNP